MKSKKIIVAILFLIGIVAVIIYLNFSGSFWTSYSQDQYGFTFGFPIYNEYGKKYEFFESSPLLEFGLFKGVIHTDIQGDDADRLISVHVYDEEYAFYLERIMRMYSGIGNEERIDVETDEMEIDNTQVTKVKVFIDQKLFSVHYIFSAPRDTTKTVDLSMWGSNPHSFFKKFEATLEIND